MSLIRSFIFIFICSSASAEPVPYQVTDFRATEVVSSHLSRSIELGSSLFFVKDIPSSRLVLGDYYGTLFRTDGSATGTKGVSGATFDSGEIFVVIAENSHRPAVCGDRLYFVGSSGNGVRRVYGIGENEAKATAVGNVYDVRHLTTVGSHIFFTGVDSSLSSYLWKSDGTTSGTVRITNSKLGVNPVISSMRQLNGKLYFYASGSLFQSDGTNNGTVPVKTPSSLDPYIALISFNNDLYFATQYGFYKSVDPDLAPIRIQNGHIRMARQLGGSLILITSDVSGILTLWKSDGSSTGTTRLLDLPGSDYDYDDKVNFVAELGGSLYFGVTKESETLKLWKTDGSVDGTELVWGSSSARQGVREAILYRNRMYLALDDENLNREIWSSDGTAAGTHLVAKTAGREFRVAGSLLYFFSPGYPQGDELFAFDDTPPAAPEVIGSVTGVTRFSADFALTIDPNRSDTTVTIHYGPTPAYGSQKEIHYRPTSGTLPEAATATLNDLSHGTIYYYKVVAVNGSGDAATENRTFTTVANRAPSLAPMDYFVYNRSVLPLAVGDLLRRANDPESDSMVVTLGASSSGASVTWDGEQFLYTQAPHFVGTDHITYTVTDQLGASTDSVLSIHVAGDFGHPWLVGGPRIYRFNTLQPSSTTVIFVSSANPGQSYLVQRSTDLHHWEHIGTSIGDDGGMIHFLDEEPPQDKAFYRLVKP